RRPRGAADRHGVLRRPHAGADRRASVLQVDGGADPGLREVRAGVHHRGAPLRLRRGERPGDPDHPRGGPRLAELRVLFPARLSPGAGARRPREMMDYAGDRLKHLHIADVFDHTANVGNRYIMNPPGVDARIHQHNEIGNGEIDWDDAFAYLREREYDGPVSVCVFGWEE